MKLPSLARIKILLLLILAVSSTGSAVWYFQQSSIASASLQLTDAITNIPIANATIFTAGLHQVTDSKGIAYFANLAAGKSYQFLISASGYLAYNTSQVLTAGQTPIKIEMVPAPSIPSIIEPGSLGMPCTYFVYLDGSTTLARNCQTGKNDYSGASSATIIATALNSASTNSMVTLACGFYTISATISTTGDNKGLIGTDRSCVTLFLANGVNADILDIGDGTTSTQNFQMRDMQLTGNKANNSAGNCITTNFVRTGRFERLTLFGCQGSGFSGIATTPGGSTSSISNIIYGCTIASNNARGIWLQSNTEEWHIISNTVDFNGQSGILFSSSGQSYVIGNEVYSDGQISGGIGGIDVDSSQRVLIEGNQIANENFHGIYLRVGADRCIVIGNELWDNSFGAGQANGWDGINLAAKSCLIQGNSSKDVQAQTQRYGINEVSGADNNTIIGNTVSPNLTGSIHLSGTLTKASSNNGFDPIGKITNFINAGGFVGACGTSATIVSATVYTVCGTDVVITSSGGTCTNNQIQDNLGNVMTSGLNGFLDQYVPFGFKVEWVCSVLPTTNIISGL